MAARKSAAALMLLGLAALAGAGSASADGTASFQDPPLFASTNGVLDLLMIAQPQTVTAFTGPGFAPTGWVYQICARPVSGNACPAGTIGAYGGVRLGLQPGDLLKIRLVNQLPPVDPSLLERVVDDPLLALNPTNLHTHGLIVPASANSTPPPAVPVYGDFVFTSVFNPANGNPATYNPGAYDVLHAHGDIVANGVVDYAIQLPPNHPSGAFWFHPHMHGIALNQVSAGMAGIISVGSVSNYACKNADCSQRMNDGDVRHLVLKDMEVLAGSGGGMPKLQEDTAFCQPLQMPGEPTRNGACQGDPAVYPGSYWFFTVSGQQFPTIPITGQDGQIWRFQNASGSATYDLQLTDDATGQPMILQLISVDGVSITVPQGVKQGQLVRLGGTRFKFADCPGAGQDDGAFGPLPVCVTEVIMMPSSRAEVWVTHRNAAGQVAPATGPATATLETRGFDTGPTGDYWPNVNLAKVQFGAGEGSAVTGPALHVKGEALSTFQRGGIFRTAAVDSHRVQSAPKTLPPGCAALAPGHHRRIYYGNPTSPDSPSTPGFDQYGDPIFGLGYEEIDQNGNPVPGTFVDFTRYDPANVICLPLAPGNQPAVETWEMINLTTELHNFHMHQTKFLVVDQGAPISSYQPAVADPGDGLMEDNVPLPYAVPGPQSQPVLFPGSGSCTIADFKAGNCQVTPVMVRIPFSQLGEFVYHCHILEHEDGGMMHAIQVVASPD
jgi:L-ascorbate oxidase